MHGGRHQDKGKALLLRELTVQLLLAPRVAFGSADLICGSCSAGRCNIQLHSKSQLLSGLCA